MLLADALIEGIRSDGIRYSIHLLFEILISILALFLILLVLVQRGRGGGIAGALGGMGGNSAFGTKAGDTFTWITYGTAAVWILLAMLTIKTFTDPPQDRARVTAEREEEELLPDSPIDVRSPRGTDGEKADDTDAADTDAEVPGVDAEKKGDDESSTPAEKTPAEKEDAGSSEKGDAATDKAETETDPGESEKTSDPQDPENTPSDEPK